MPDPTPERWLPVPGYEGFYEVSAHGLIRGMRRRGSSGQPLRPSHGKHGHLRVCLHRNNSGKYFLVHQIVMLAFVGPCPAGMEVCHNDGDPENNRLSNLRYDTHAGNMQDMIRHGTSYWANKTHCPAGHEYTPDNTYINPTSGGRQCRDCRSAPFKLRGYGSHNRAKTHCPQGHEYTKANTYIRPNGSRECRTCLRQHQQRMRDAKKLSKSSAANGIEAGRIKLEDARL